MEFFGTFILVYLTGLFYVQHAINKISTFELAAGTFCVVAVMTWIGKSISGSHYNPAISFSLAITKHLKWSNFLVYSLFQCFAAFFAVSMLRFSFSNRVAKDFLDKTMLGFPKVETDVWTMILFEVIGTFFIVFAYYLLVLEKNAPRHVYGAGMGAVAFVTMLFAIKKTGSGLNPAKMFAYCFLTKSFGIGSIYISAPLAGAAIGALVGNLLLSENAATSRLKKKQEKRRKTLAAVAKSKNTVEEI